MGPVPRSRFHEAEFAASAGHVLVGASELGAGRGPSFCRRTSLLPSSQDRFRLSPVTAGLLFELALLPVAVGLGWLVGIDPLHSFRSTQWLPHTLLGLLAAGPMGLLFVWIDRSTWSSAKRLRRLVERTVRSWLRGSSHVTLVLLSLAAGLGEEVLFRGLIQQLPSHWLGSSVLSLSTGLLLASVLFGLAHAATVLYAVLATGIGLYLGVWVLWTGNLWPAVVAHAAYDMAALAYLLHRRQKKEKAT